MKDRFISIWNSISVAITFSTRLPFVFLPLGSADKPVPSVVTSLWAFPLAGVLIGLIAGFIAVSLQAATALSLLSAIVVVASATIVCGALHEDGLADTADSLWGGSTRERRHEILKDSRLGSYGVLALIFVFGAKIAALSAILDHLNSWMVLLLTLVAVHMLSRSWFGVITLFCQRIGDDKQVHHLESTDLTWVSACVPAVLVSVFAGFIFGSLQPMIWCMIVSALIVIMVQKSYLGLRGDHLGAAQQLMEAGILAVLAMHVSKVP